MFIEGVKLKLMFEIPVKVKVNIEKIPFLFRNTNNNRFYKLCHS
jgi:hypothetical protein